MTKPPFFRRAIRLHESYISFFLTWIRFEMSSSSWIGPKLQIWLASYGSVDCKLGFQLLFPSAIANTGEGVYRRKQRTGVPPRATFSCCDPPKWAHDKPFLQLLKAFIMLQKNRSSLMGVSPIDRAPLLSPFAANEDIVGQTWIALECRGAWRLVVSFCCFQAASTSRTLLTTSSAVTYSWASQWWWLCFLQPDGKQRIDGFQKRLMF